MRLPPRAAEAATVGLPGEVQVEVGLCAVDVASGHIMVGQFVDDEVSTSSSTAEWDARKGRGQQVEVGLYVMVRITMDNNRGSGKGTGKSRRVLVLGNAEVADVGLDMS